MPAILPDLPLSGRVHGKRYSHASRIDRIRTCDPMLPKHVRYQTAPQSDIFDRTPWLTSYVRALLNAISSDSGTVLSQYHDAFILILSRV